jgi:TolA-binding protein
MTRRLLSVSALASILLAGLSASPARALDEAERLWLVGDRAFADGLYPVARRALDRFVVEYPNDTRIAPAMLLLGRSRLALGEPEKALDAFRRLRAIATLPGQQLEGRFWEAESLFRLKQFAAARAAYDDVIGKDAASPLAPEALFGLGLCELELKRPEQAIKAFRDLLASWPEHATAASATYYQAQALVDLKRYAEAVPLLTGFATRYPSSKLAPDAQYLLGSTHLAMGERDLGVSELRAFIAAYPEHPQAAAVRRQITAAIAKGGTPAQQHSTYSQLMQPSATAENLYDAGVIAGKAGKVKDQQTAWARLRKEFPHHPLAYQVAYDLAEAAFKRKEWGQAVTQAKAATASEDEGLRARALLLEGESELKLSRFKDAAKSFEAVGGVKNLEPGDRYRALAGLGLAREQLGEIRAALAAYDAVASKSPDATLRTWARDRAAAVRAQPSQPAKPATGGEKKS